MRAARPVCIQRSNCADLAVPLTSEAYDGPMQILLNRHHHPQSAHVRLTRNPRVHHTTQTCSAKLFPSQPTYQ